MNSKKKKMEDSKTNSKPEVVDPDDMDTVRISDDELYDILNGASDDSLGVKFSFSSIIGTRDYQQDSLYADRINGIVFGVVCDGMGGLEGGEKASRTAVKVLSEDFWDWSSSNDYRESAISDFLRREAEKMDEAVSELKNDKGEFMDAGTTSVAVIIVENRVYWLSIGDSRIYHMRGEKIRRITRDHNVQMLIDEEKRKGTISEEDYRRKKKQAEALVSFVGMGGLRIIDTNENGRPIHLEENDIIILCSDGLYKRLKDNEIAEIVYCEEPDMERAARRLTEVVQEKTVRNQDNTSVVVMQYNKYYS